MSKNEGSKKTVDLDTACFVMVILLVVGIATGYTWHMAQVKAIEDDIVYALTNCKQLITEELVITPNLGCESLKTGTVGLKKGTFNYYNNKIKEKRNQ